MSEKIRLCIVPCGSAKIWDKNPNTGPEKAKNVYTGVFAVACQRYAKTFFKDWVILSAKHGFLFPDEIVDEAYNVSFIKPNSETIGVAALREQAIHKGLLDYNEITVLGGKHYVERVSSIFNEGQTIMLPLSDCKGIGYMLQRLTTALDGKEQLSDNVNHNTPPQIKRVVLSTTESIGKYKPLYEYLRNREESTVTLTIDELEDLLGFTLPSSAIKHRAWWANDTSHSHAKAWLLADWEVEIVALPMVTLSKLLESETGTMNRF